MSGALADIKVVEFAQNVAAPHCGRILAGMGADVLKVEPITGDAMRRLAELAPDEGRAYSVVNPGKRAMCLDLSDGRAVPVIDGLLRWADIAIMGFKQSDLQRYHLDWERTRTINERLVQVVVTAFGPRGPDADQGGYDVLAQGLSGVGFMMNRSANGVPLPTRPAVFDYATGIMASSAALAALRHREKTGQGQRIDASLLGTAVALGGTVVCRFDSADTEPLQQMGADLTLLRTAGADFDEQRALYDSRTIPAGGAFRLYFRHYLTADGLISVAGLTAGLADKFHTVTGVTRPAGVSPGSPEFDAVVTEAEELFATKTTAEWMQVLRAVGYPCNRYNTPFEAVDDPQIRANDYVVDLEHPTFGSYATTGMPVHMSETPAVISGPSPRIGEHTYEALQAIGLDQDQIDSLHTAGVVRLGSGGEQD